MRLARHGFVGNHVQIHIRHIGKESSLFTVGKKPEKA